MTSTFMMILSAVCGTIIFFILNRIFRITYFGFKGMLNFYLTCIFLTWIGFGFIIYETKSILGLNSEEYSNQSNEVYNEEQYDNVENYEYDTENNVQHIESLSEFTTIQDTNIRDNPSLDNSGVVTTVKSKSKLIRLNNDRVYDMGLDGIERYWYYVETEEGITGWVSERALSEIMNQGKRKDGNLFDYYKILEGDENSSTEVMKNAYKALAKKYHADIYIEDRIVAEEKMKLINIEY